MFESAGIKPQLASDAQNAIFTLKHTFDIDASRHIPRDIRSLKMADYDLIIALDKRAANAAASLGVASLKVKLWTVRDPWGGDLAEYDRTGLEIKKKLVQLKASGGSHEA